MAIKRKLALFALLVVPTLGRAEAGMEALISQCVPWVHPKTMGAIIRHESGGNPYRLLDNGPAGVPLGHRVVTSYTATSKAEAVQIATTLIAQGHVVDMGLTMVSSPNLSKLGMTVEQMFEPCSNLRAGGRILSDFYSKALVTSRSEDRALVKAVSAYNTGSFSRGVSNGYVMDVVTAARKPIPQIKVSSTSTTASQLVSTSGKRYPRQSRPATHHSLLLDAKLSSIEVEGFVSR